MKTMNRTSYAIALLGVTLGTAACASRGGSDTPPAPTASDHISMARGPCFGACPMYRVTIRGDGRVTFEGDRFVEITGEHTGTADPAEVAALFAHLDSIGYFRMPSNITPSNESACGGHWTDMPSAELSVVYAGASHDVNHYHGCPKAPESLMRLEARIDAVAGSQRWIGGRE